MLFVAAALLSCSESSDDEEQIRETYERYEEALIAEDGEAAAALVSQETLSYYEEMGALAVAGTPSAIQQRRLIDQLFILAIRLQLKPDRISTMNGAELFTYAVDQGLVSSSSVERLDIGDIVVAGDAASADATYRGETAPFDWKFMRENGAWKLNAIALLEEVNRGFEEAREKAGLTREQFLLETFQLDPEELARATDLWESVPEEVG